MIRKFFICLFGIANFILSTAQTKSNISLNAAAFKEATTATNIQVLDVRTAAEYNAGHLKNALQTFPGNRNTISNLKKQTIA